MKRSNGFYCFTFGNVSDMIIDVSQIYDDLRKAIDASGKSRYRLWQETDVSQAQLSQFMAGSKGLSVEALERLAAALGMDIFIKPKRRRKRM